MTDVVIIGAGAAGLMAGIYAQENGAQSLILERNEKAGKKIYITGKGRCNLTNDCDAEDFLKEVPRNPRFLYSALSLLSPRTLMQRMEDWGCPVVVQRGRRVFPATEKASDVTRTLLRRYEQLRVDVTGGDPLLMIHTRLPDDTVRDVYRVVLTGETESAPDLHRLYQNLSEMFFELQLRDETHLRRDLWERAGEDSLRGIFLRKLKERYDAAKSDAEKQQIEQAARWGLAALNNAEEVVQHEDP